MDRPRSTHIPSSVTLLAMLAAVIGLAVFLACPAQRHRSDAIPGLTYTPKGNAPGTPMALVVTSVEDASPAASAPIAAGDVIDRIDGHPIASVAAVRKTVRRDAKRGRGIDVRVRHAGRWRYKHLPAARRLNRE